jgi:hypothetical protein
MRQMQYEQRRLEAQQRHLEQQLSADAQQQHRNVQILIIKHNEPGMRPFWQD